MRSVSFNNWQKEGSFGPQCGTRFFAAWLQAFWAVPCLRVVGKVKGYFVELFQSEAKRETWRSTLDLEGGLWQ